MIDNKPNKDLLKNMEQLCFVEDYPGIEKAWKIGDIYTNQFTKKKYRIIFIKKGSINNPKFHKTIINGIWTTNGEKEKIDGIVLFGVNTKNTKEERIKLRALKEAKNEKSRLQG